MGVRSLQGPFLCKISPLERSLKYERIYKSKSIGSLLRNGHCFAMVFVLFGFCFVWVPSTEKGGLFAALRRFLRTIKFFRIKHFIGLDFRRRTCYHEDAELYSELKLCLSLRLNFNGD